MELLIQIIFVLISTLILGAAVMVVRTRNVIHSALWLIASFFGIGALYLLLEAEFLAIAQVLIYVGAISVLILFAIMLTHNVTSGEGHKFYQRWWLALLVSLMLFAVILVPTLVGQDWTITARPSEESAIAGAVEMGTAFMREYLLPFEIAAVLLLVALTGAIVIAYEERAQRRRILTLAQELALRKQQQQNHAEE
ncbi:MAG: NADH-quinone oxidoreductase subunit J [Chloroflexaceae bacterium]|nr:NADH-quinone oxidoreductase subunit J [Chloroflexaceae bacterium]